MKTDDGICDDDGLDEGLALLEQEVLRYHRSYATGATELHSHDGEVKQGEQEVPHCGSAYDRRRAPRNVAESWIWPS
jgi:hypothetical protein